jgi:hypothetical protein
MKCKLYPKQNQLEHTAKIETLLEKEALLKTYRGYLSNLSWLMKSIDCAEDKVSGRFWEGFTPTIWRHWRQAA